MSKMTINPKVRNRYLQIGRLRVRHQKLQPHPTLAEQHPRPFVGNVDHHLAVDDPRDVEGPCPLWPAQLHLTKAQAVDGGV